MLFFIDFQKSDACKYEALAWDKYRDIAVEVEARDVQRRMNMTQFEIKQASPDTRGCVLSQKDYATYIDIMRRIGHSSKKEIESLEKT